MYLRHISILNYKNLSEVNIDFCNGVNVVLGNNGQGKTNLLDAIYYLAFCKSKLNPLDSQNIKHGESYFMIEGMFNHSNTEDIINVGIKKNQAKSFKKNKKEYDRLADHIGLIPLIMISPNDINLILEGSIERRKLIDSVISQYDKQYLDCLLKYNNAVKQRNIILRSERVDYDLLDVCEWQMLQYSEYIFATRKSFLQEFIPIFSDFYNKLSKSENEKVLITYKTSLFDGDLKLQLEESRQKDIILGYTSKGIHKDDIEMFLNEYALKKVGSQGQTKSFLIALKLAQYEFLKQHSGVKPLLLLDDIFDKLDSLRVDNIIDIISNKNFGQTFISDTNIEYFKKLENSVSSELQCLNVCNGVVQYMSN